MAAVTGGASGIGVARCRALAAESMTAAVLDPRDRAGAVASEVGGRPCSADVSDEAASSACAGRIEAGMGPVEMLVDNAGVLGRRSALPRAPWRCETRWRGWTGAASGSAARCPAGAWRGGIANVASVASLRAAPLHAHGPAKAAVAATAANPAAEWAPAGARVNAVSPGFVETPAPRAEVEAGRRDLPLIAGAEAPGRAVRVEEVAQAVVFLAGGPASATTGVNLPVDCGRLAATGWAAHGGLRGPEGADA